MSAPGRSSRATVAWLAVCVAALGPSRAAAQADRILVGAVTEDLVSISDPSQRYAVYVPSTYRPDRAWPLLVVMDPRGRALIPLERLVEPAERLGWVLISSYNTASDGPVEVNQPAVEAMIDDAQRFVSVDPRRLYFVGFSGTARLAWAYGSRLAEYTAGIIGFGAGQPAPFYLASISARQGAPFAYFGGAGERDFNFEEVVQLDWDLDAYGFQHHVEMYPAGHEWPPAQVFERALEWMEVHAMRDGLRPRDPELIESLYRKRIDEARRLAEDGSVHTAALRYRSIVADFEDLLDVDEPRRRAEELADSDAFEDMERWLERTVEASDRYDDRSDAFFDRIRESGRPPDLEEALRTFDVAELQERAARADDPNGALAAQRLLERTFTRLRFYEPRAYMAEGEFELAAAMYRLADAIHPDVPIVCLGLGQAYAQMGEVERAFEALECVRGAGSPAAAALESDPLLAPLRGDPRFAELIGRLR